jgi:acyl carrier protein
LVVADCLGVSPDVLTPELSLADDLAADSLDLLELALALEAEFGIVVPESMLDRARSYGDLVKATITVTRAQRAAETGREDPPRIWTLLVPPDRRGGGLLAQAGRLTRYTAQTIIDAALRAGRGASLEVTVDSEATDAALARARSAFAPLRDRGVSVRVGRGTPPERVRAHAGRAAEEPEQLRLPFEMEHEQRRGPQPAGHDEPRARRALSGNGEAR